MSPDPAWIQPGKPAVVLAPMEGVTDAPMRAFLTELGGLSFCVSEFLRITHQLYPALVFKRHVPELARGGVTASGVRVQVQLLGGDADLMARSAWKAVRLGAGAIDINFGCPAATVNRRDGGATLLKYPCRIEEIVGAVRMIVPKHIPVSAKLRLGWESIEDIHENAARAEAGGASWITIHARTRAQGYARPVYWEKIAEVRRALGIPVVANGDIWDLEDFRRCRAVTGCEHFMVGRGAVANPFLAREISAELGLDIRRTFDVNTDDWGRMVDRFVWWSGEFQQDRKIVPGRIKQWLRMGERVKPNGWFAKVKTAATVEEITRVFA